MIRSDRFDCFRRAYVAGMLDEAADAMPPRKRREFRKFLKSLPTGEVRDSDGTATAAANGDLPVPQDCQARAGTASPESYPKPSSMEAGG